MSEQNGGVYDARKLGYNKMLVLGFQHMFAMFGATVLVPALTGLSVSATLLFAGLGTLLFHFLTKGKVPAFLGSSFAFIGGYKMVAWTVETLEGGEKVEVLHPELLPYACLGVLAAGALYLVLAGLIKAFGQKKVMRFFPPIVTGPIIIAIGLTLSSSAIDSCQSNWLVAILAILVVIVCNIFGKGMIKIVPILLGVIVSYIAAICLHIVDFSAVSEAAWIGLPFKMEDTVFAVFKSPDGSKITNALITIMPIALATMVEHIGDISAISSTTNKNFIEDPGLHRTLLGDGLATMLASLFGAPANTTYGENTGVLSLTKVYDPRVIRIAAYCAILFSFCPKFAALIGSLPAATIGGVSIVLYGMISAVGVRNIVENQVDFGKSRNVIIAALILGLSVGVKYCAAESIDITLGSVDISLTGLAVGALVGIIFNAVLPLEEKEYSGVKKDMKSEG
ncbi:MAG: uracil-xanthine permease [Clostridiales bacterium]|nr:uracil-xanthine permease [Clostridiales bacterium]